jgi:hypothetical protein
VTGIIIQKCGAGKLSGMRRRYAGPQRNPSPRPEPDPAPTEQELTAWIELARCDADLERILERLAAARAGLAFPSTAKGRAAPAAELDTALGCLAEHLRPAREAVRRFEEGFFPGERAEQIAAWAQQPRAYACAGHERFHTFLADARGEELPALRHLLGCPVCQRLARLVLFGFLPGAAQCPARPRRRHRRKPSNDRHGGER